MKKDEESTNKKKDDIVVKTTESSEKIEEDNTWTDGIVLAIHILLPLVIAGLIWGRKTILGKIISQLDRSCIAVFCPSFSKRERLLKWATTHLPYMEGGLGSMWRDGSQLCALINSAIPGACPNPHRHWRKPPSHGQALAYKYLGVIPVFTEDDFKERNLTSSTEKKLIEYISALQQAISKITPNEETSYSNDFVARGMGLVTGEQHRKTIFYIYPNTKTIETLFINIRGPYNTYGSVTLNDPDLKKDDKSFFSKLLPKNKTPICDIKIKIFQEHDRAKITFIPSHSGVYEVCLTTHGEHITGSPYNINIEKNRSGKIDTLKNEETLYIIKGRGIINEENNNESDGSYDYDGETCCIRADSEIEEEIVKLLGDQDLVCPKISLQENNEVNDSKDPNTDIVTETKEIIIDQDFENKSNIHDGNFIEEFKSEDLQEDSNTSSKDNIPKDNINEEFKNQDLPEYTNMNSLEDTAKTSNIVETVIEDVKVEELIPMSITADTANNTLASTESNLVGQEENSEKLQNNNEILCDENLIPKVPSSDPLQDKDCTFPKMKLQELRIQEILKNNTKENCPGKDTMKTPILTIGKTYSHSDQFSNEESKKELESDAKIGLSFKKILRGLEDNKDIAVCLNVSIEEIECIDNKEKVTKEEEPLISHRDKKRVQRQKVVDNSNAFIADESSLKSIIKEFEDKSLESNFQNGTEKSTSIETLGTRRDSLGSAQSIVSSEESVSSSTKKEKLKNEKTVINISKYDKNTNVFPEVEKGKNNIYVPDYPKYLKRGMSLSTVEDRLGNKDTKTRRKRFLGGSLEIFTKEENNNIRKINKNLSSSVEADICYLLLKENLEKITTSTQSLSNYDPDLLRGHTNPEKKPQTSSILKNIEKEVREISKVSNVSTGNVKEANLPNLVAETGKCVDALDFKEQFLRRREYWDKISSKNTSLNSSYTSLAEPETTWKPKSERNLTLNQSHPSTDYGSVDELNIPSVRERKRMFLNEPRIKEVKKVFESIHERIMLFDNGFDVRNKQIAEIPKYKENDIVFKSSKVKKVKHIPDNGTIKAKLKERFEKAHRFFKKLEKNDKRASLKKSRNEE